LLLDREFSAAEDDVMERLRQLARTLSLGLLLVCAIAGLLWIVSPSLLAPRLRNDQIEWNGGFVGLYPTTSSWWPKLVVWRGKGCVPNLLQALRSDEQFVAAHVCLTWILKKENIHSAEAWNGLHVDLLADGRTVIPSTEKERVFENWAATSPP
jgi:hypothetical protein